MSQCGKPVRRYLAPWLTYWLIPEGTPANAKRDGAESWEPIETTRDLAFSVLYDESEYGLLFYEMGWLLLVEAAFVEVREPRQQ